MTLYLVSIQVSTLDIGDIGGCRHELDNAIEKLLDALVLMGRTTEYGDTLRINGSLAKSGLQLIDGRLLALEVHHHQVLIEVAALLNELGVIRLCLLLEVIADIDDFDILSNSVLVEVLLQLKEVDDALEVIFLTDRELYTYGVLAELRTDLLDGVEEICTQDIHLVDEGHTGYMIGISLTPYILRLRLYTTLCVEIGRASCRERV